MNLTQKRGSYIFWSLNDLLDVSYFEPIVNFRTFTYCSQSTFVETKGIAPYPD